MRANFVCCVVTWVVASCSIAGCGNPEGVKGGSEASALEQDTEARPAVAFVPNRGQLDGAIRFFSRGGRNHVYLGSSTITVAMAAQQDATSTPRGHALKLELVGASSRATLRASEQLPGHVNHLVGDPGRWQRELPRVAEVLYEQPWPGIDLRVRRPRGQLKYEMVVAPGADPSDVRMQYRGADSVTQASDGSLRVQTPVGALVDTAPVAHQEIDGTRRPVPVSFELGSDGRFGFEVGSYDSDRPLVIDPGLTFSTFLGASGGDFAEEVRVGGEGAVYAAGRTSSGLEFPHTFGPFAPDSTLFVTKLDPTGSTVVYSTLLGGSGSDFLGGLALGPRGRAVLGGTTDSSDFPTTGELDDNLEGPDDAYVLQLDERGDLGFGTFVGGDGGESGRDVAVDGDNNIYVSGFTFSSDFPVTPGSFGSTGGLFISKISRFRSFFEFSGRSRGTVNALELVPADAGGGVIVAGNAGPTEDQRIEVRRLNQEATAFEWSVEVNGANLDQVRDLAVDANGNAYLTGETNSADFPTTPGARDRELENFNEPFAIKLRVDDGSVAYSTLLGGPAEALGRGIAVTPRGSAYVTGFTSEDGIHVVEGSLFPSFAGGGLDGFVTRLTPDGSGLIHSTYLGGSMFDTAQGIALAPSGDAVVVGDTSSDNFPVTPGAFDVTYNGGLADAFVAKVPLDPIPETVIVVPSEPLLSVDTSGLLQVDVADHLNLPVPEVPVRMSLRGGPNDPQSVLGSCETAGDGTCEIRYQPPGIGSFVFTAWVDVDEDGVRGPNEPSDEFIQAVVPADASERGHVTGVGHVQTEQGHWLTFFLTAHARHGRVRGGCFVYDFTARELSVCKRLDGFARFDGQAVVSAILHRGQQRLRALFTLVDGGLPGRGRDSFELLTEQQRVAGPLQFGHVRVHR